MEQFKQIEIERVDYSDSSDESCSYFDENICRDDYELPIERCLYFLDKKLDPAPQIDEFTTWFLTSFNDIYNDASKVAFQTLTKLLEIIDLPLQDYPNIIEKVYQQVYVSEKQYALETLNMIISKFPEAVQGKENFFQTLFEQSCEIQNEIMPRSLIWKLIATALDIESITIDIEYLQRMMNIFDKLKSNEKKMLIQIVCSILAHKNFQYSWYCYCGIRDKITEIMMEWGEFYPIESLRIAILGIIEFEDKENFTWKRILDEVLDSRVSDSDSTNEIEENA